MTQPTPLYRLVEAKLGRPLADYIADNRAQMSWRAMAIDLTERTGETVTHETLRAWFADRIRISVVDLDAPAGAA